jgi:hypothetical protein
VRDDAYMKSRSRHTPPFVAKLPPCANRPRSRLDDLLLRTETCCLSEKKALAVRRLNGRWEAVACRRRSMTSVGKKRTGFETHVGYGGGDLKLEECC